MSATTYTIEDEQDKKCTIRYLKELIKDLPDDMILCEEDTDESHLRFCTERIKIDGGNLLFTPYRTLLAIQERTIIKQPQTGTM